MRVTMKLRYSIREKAGKSRICKGNDRALAQDAAQTEITLPSGKTRKVLNAAAPHYDGVALEG